MHAFGSRATVVYSAFTEACGESTRHSSTDDSPFPFSLSLAAPSVMDPLRDLCDTFARIPGFSEVQTRRASSPNDCALASFESACCIRRRDKQRRPSPWSLSLRECSAVLFAQSRMKLRREGVDLCGGPSKRMRVCNCRQLEVSVHGRLQGLRRSSREREIRRYPFCTSTACRKAIRECTTRFFGSTLDTAFVRPRSAMAADNQPFRRSDVRPW